MCSGSFAKCLGITLIPLSIVCVLCNILLFFPGGKPVEQEHITQQVWFFGGILGSGVLMIFPALVFLGLKNNDCCGCCGNKSCGERFADGNFASVSHRGGIVVVETHAHTDRSDAYRLSCYVQMLSSILFAAVGVLGAGYSVIVSSVSINQGPLCLFNNTMNNTLDWGYPFSDGDYLSDKSLWDTCHEPQNVVSWHLSLFSVLLVMGLIQTALCAVQMVNGLLGALCGDCCGCCGSDGAV